MEERKEREETPKTEKSPKAKEAPQAGAPTPQTCKAKTPIIAVIPPIPDILVVFRFSLKVLTKHIIVREKTIIKENAKKT